MRLHKTDVLKNTNKIMSQIFTVMKKAILTFGLFSLMMVLTSFTAPVEIGGYEKPKPTMPTLNVSSSYEIGGYEKPRPTMPTLNVSSSYEIGGYEKPRPTMPN